MRASFIEWNSTYSKDQIRQLKDNGYRTIVISVSNGMIENHTHCDWVGSGRGDFTLVNFSPFRHDCEYSAIILSNPHNFRQFTLGIRIDYEADIDEDELMLMTLKYGQNFFYQPLEIGS